jgi:hypothetical protein
LAGAVALLVLPWLTVTAVRAQYAGSEQEHLFQVMLRDPRNIEATFAFVKVATANADYEAAIGALERILFFQPNQASIKYELGSLYFRLGSYEMAKQYFRDALATPGLDPAVRERIETAMPDAEKQLQQSRLSVFVQTGMRYQTNANFAPTSGTVRLGGQDLALLSSSTRKSDLNWFGLAGVSHDYDLNNQRGDTLETRFVGYGTQQAKFNELNIGLFDLSFGPRLALAPELLPGVTVKPYVVGGSTWVNGRSYLMSAGAGISARVPFGDRFTFGPEFEWRKTDVNTGDVVPVSTFSSGDWFTAGLSGSSQISQQVRLDARGLYRRAEARNNFQQYDQWVAEAAITFQFAPPLGLAARNWSLSPFARFIRTEFDAANPFIDPLTTRRDTEWMTGVMLDTALGKTLGFSTVVQYNRVNSSLPNYRQNNFTVMLGPTARF